MDNNFKKVIAESLSKPAEKLANARNLHLLRVEVRGTQSAPVIEVLLDGNRAVTIDDCETVSKSLSSMIDEEKLVKGNYRLDVMSPGMDEPIVEDWQFERSIDRLVEVQYEDGGEHHSVHGRLRSFNNKEIAFEPIHLKAKKPARPKEVTTEAGLITLEPDEQLYDDPVELVKVERRHLKKVVVQAEFGKG